MRVAFKTTNSTHQIPLHSRMGHGVTVPEQTIKTGSSIPPAGEPSFLEKLELLFSSQPLTLIENAKVLLSNGQFVPKTLIVTGNKIAAIPNHVPQLFKSLRAHVQKIDAKNMLVTPGLIDQHTHGALGCDFNQASPTQIQQLLEKLPAYGVTGILATLMTSSLDQMKQAIDRVSQVADNPQPGKTRVLGLHLEGPFINKDYKGAHLESQLHKPDVEKMQPMINPHIKLVTLAPELDTNLTLTKFLKQNNVQVSAGHSAATYAQMQSAVQAGVSGVTHLFNAMPALHHREPGIAGAGLSIPGLTSELIADGIHINPAVLQTAIRSKPQDMILVTDSMALAGLSQGSKGFFGGQEVQVHNNAVHLCCDSSRLAGSSVMLNQCVENVTRWGITPFAQAIEMASKHPAKHLGIKDLGSLHPGATADFVLWDEKTLAVKQTWINGQKAYQAPEQLHIA